MCALFLVQIVGRPWRSNEVKPGVPFLPPLASPLLLYHRKISRRLAAGVLRELLLPGSTSSEAIRERDDDCTRTDGVARACPRTRRGDGHAGAPYPERGVSRVGQ